MTEGERECERVKGVLKKGVLAREEDKGWEKGRKGERRRKRLREGEKRQERVREEECQNIAAIGSEIALHHLLHSAKRRPRNLILEIIFRFGFKLEVLSIVLFVCFQRSGQY